MSKKALALGFALFAASSIAMAQPPNGGPGMDGQRGPGGGQGMMRHMDTDGDGKVSQAEHQASTAGRFQKLDANNDGFLTQEEMQAGRAKREEFQKKMQELRQQYRQQ